MKALEKLNNIERAKIIHTLFPTEVGGFLEFTLTMANKTANSLEDLKEGWRLSITSPEYWCHLAGNIRTIINADKLLLTKDCKRFAEWLFGGYNALFMTHCLTHYAKQLKKPKFEAAVTLFFSDDAEN